MGLPASGTTKIKVFFLRFVYKCEKLSSLLYITEVWCTCSDVNDCYLIQDITRFLNWVFVLSCDISSIFYHKMVCYFTKHVCIYIPLGTMVPVSIYLHKITEPNISFGGAHSIFDWRLVEPKRFVTQYIWLVFVY